MSEEINKTSLEKAIHEKATEKYMDEVQALQISLKNSPLSEAIFKMKGYTNGGMELDSLCDGTTYEFEKWVLEPILKNYSEFKKEKIAEYERQETDNLLDSLEGIKEFINND